MSLKSGSSASPAGSGPCVLLVGADPAWSRAVRAAADSVGATCLVAVASGREGVRRLLHPPMSFTHVLLNPARDDGLLDTFLNLTCDEYDTPTELLVLGRSAATPAHACAIDGPTQAAVADALARGCGTRRTRRPTMRELRVVLSERRVETRYQPLVEMADRALRGLEVLARMPRGRGGVFGPEHFVPPIEAAGLGGELTMLVAGRGFADATAPFLAAGAPQIGLNVPLDVLLKPGTLGELDRLRDAVGLPAAQVTIELTESRTVFDVPCLDRAVTRLRQAGYGVALDDISPEMPGFEALLDVPFTSTKIDQGVVRRSADSAEAAAFIHQVIARARARGLRVIAEGVHDVPTWHRMRRAGIDLAQGFVIAPPLPAAAIPHWAALWRDRTDLD